MTNQFDSKMLKIRLAEVYLKITTSIHSTKLTDDVLEELGNYFLQFG